MIKVTLEVETQEEFEFAYQKVMGAVGEVCDGVFGCLVSVVKTSPPAPSPAERGDFEEKEAIILNTLKKLEYEDLVKIADKIPSPLPESSNAEHLRNWLNRKHEWKVLDYPVDEVEAQNFLKRIMVEDVSLEMMQDDTTPLVDRAIQKNGLCNVLGFLKSKDTSPTSKQSLFYHSSVYPILAIYLNQKGFS